MADKIAIIGLGLIGGSIGLGLAAARKRDKSLSIEIVGHDRLPENASKAKRVGAIDKIEWNLLAAVDRAAMVIIATPVLAVRTVMEQIADTLANGATVTDTASTKAEVVQWADELLPDYVTFVGGHPMAGKELPGVENAEADLFKDAVWCLCPGRNAEQSRVDVVAAFVEVMGAKPYFVDPHEHDGLVAGISHLPIILASALVSATTADPAWREMKKLASSGYRDTSRLASGEPQMNVDICLTNRGPLLGWIDRYIEELQHYRSLIAQGHAGAEALAKEFVRVQMERDRWAYGKKDAEGEETIQKISLGQMLMGDRFSRLTEYLRQGERRRS
ncbi:MAG: prephenate dehydrogenase/arogenate dehydrogenase family protein [Chloroflexota bacterium]|nr:prephenate dehydrogenase/arogenate dehydrogenase family protein [Dehalococcoidia bacterium]MDW8254479.1 prephenate dehydrogenase/arogenate dehydrogenase family protein [Chloroflexota bacterium]